MKALAAPLATLLLAASFAPGTRADVTGPPAARVAVVRDTLHGVVIEDPYRWLEDKGAPETRAWVSDEMAWTQRELKLVPGRDEVVAKLAAIAKADTRTVPRVRAGRLFYLERKAGQQQPVLVMREGPNGAETVLVDPNPMSEDHLTSVALLDVSLDGKLIAYGVRQGGEDETDVRLLDVDARREVPGGLPKARHFGVVIDPRKAGLWYGRWEPQGSRVWYHRIGDDPASDKLVFGGDLGPTEIPSPQLSFDGRWLALGISVGASGDNTRFLVRPSDSDGPFASITDTLHARVQLQWAGDRMVLHTNWNAPNGRLFVADPRTPGLAYWKPIVPERSNAVIEGVAAVGGKLVVQYLHDVSSELETYGLDGTPLGAIALPGIGAATGVAGEWSGPDAYYSFSSFNWPATIYRCDVGTRKAEAWWHSPAPFDPARYEVKQVWFTSRDGTKVPMFVVAAKNLPLDGRHPVLMTGYGGFNVSETPAFSTRTAAWLELGGVFALPNLRGGSEFGETWHRAGMLANKQHVFDDFIGAAQWLESNGYCAASKLAIIGGSNGGLLVGAAMTQRPDLFGAVVCQVPLLDMLRYQRFSIARFWVPEYGSAEDPAQFQWLRAYSPYQNVKAGVTYPSVMFVSGDSDTRVDPLHARKMAALMQSLHGPNPVLLHYDVSSGHSGGQSVDKSVEDDADVLQFLRWRLGMATPRSN